MRQIVRDYIAELRGSPLKAGAVAVLLAAGMLLWGRLLLKEVPRTAAAVDDMTFAQWQELRNGPSQARLLAAAGRVELDDPGPPDRNLFALDPSRYRRTAVEANEGGGEKYVAGRSEEEVRAAVLSAAGELKLTSIIEGEEPLAIINQTVLRPGDTVEGFTVLSLSGRSVILVRQGVRVRLSL